MLVGPPAAALADSTTQLPFGAGLPEHVWTVVDPVGQHVFVSDGQGGYSSIVVLDFDGSIVKTISVDGAAGMAIDSSTHTLYVGSAGITSDTMTEIDTTTLTVTGSFSTAPLYDLSDLVISGGKLWFIGRSAPSYADGVGSENLNGTNATTQNLGNGYALASGGASGQLLAVASQGDDLKPAIGVYDVSGGSPAPASSLADVGPVYSSLPDLAFDPSGDHLLAPAPLAAPGTDSPPGSNAVNSLLTSTLAASLQYATETPPLAVAMTSDGAYLAVGGGTGDAGTSNVMVFRASDATPWHRWNIHPVSEQALAFSPDSSRLFAVTSNGSSLEFTVLTDPTQLLAETTTSLNVSAQTVTFGQPVTLNAQVTGTTTGMLDLSAMANGTTTVVQSKAIDSSGAASFTVTPAMNTTYSATLEAGDTYTSSTSANVSVGVAPTIAIKAHAKRTTVRQFVRHGEKVIIAILVNPGAALGSPCQLQVQWSLNKRRWRTVAGGSFLAVDGTGYVGFKTKLPGYYRAQVRFGGNENYLHASSPWAKFKAPTSLR
jgi:DNA-binding beta-propeller fold protein YncE